MFSLHGSKNSQSKVLETMNKKQPEQTVLTVARAAVKKGIHNPHQLHLVTGISVPRANKLWKGTSKLDLKDIDALCENLKCKIKDLITRVPAGTRVAPRKRVSIIKRFPVSKED